MGVYIKSMEMPTSCYNCTFCEQTDFYASPYCRISDDDDMMSINEIRSKRRDNCPLVPVPPHGDLIERDYLISFCVRNKTDEWNKQVVTTYAKALDEFEDIVQDAPTIIPADKESGE